MRAFPLLVRDTSIAAQGEGHYPNVDEISLAPYNNSLRFGAALLIDNPVFSAKISHLAREE